MASESSITKLNKVLAQYGRMTYFLWYRVFIKYCVFSLKFCDFSELCQFCCSTGVLPAWCVYSTHTDTEGKQRKASVWNIIKSSEINPIFIEHPVYCQNKCQII